MSAALLFATAFLSTAADKHWTGAVSTDWFEPNNWDPPGVPATEDIAFVNTNVVVYMGFDIVINGLNLDGIWSTLDGPGNLTVTNFNWTNGFFRGSGACIIPVGGTLRLAAGGLKSLYRNLVNSGTVIQQDYLVMTAILHNAGVFDMRDNSTIAGPAFAALFENTGLFIGDQGAKTNTISIPFDNRGEMRLLSGTLRLTAYHTNEGTVSIAEGATLGLVQCPVIAPSCSLQGSGTLRFGPYPGASAINTTVLTTNPIQPRIEIVNNFAGPTGSPLVAFDSATSITECVVDGGGISGTNTITITNLLWGRGGIHGSGTIVIPATGSLMVTGNLAKYVQGRTLINYGNIEWRDSGTIQQPNNAGLLVNQGTFRALGDGFWGWRSVNEGVFVKAGSTGRCHMDIITNSGAFEVQSGTVEAARIQTQGETYLNGGNLYISGSMYLYGGTVRGAGTILGDPGLPCPSTDVHVEGLGGDIHPGNPLGVLTVDGDCRLRFQARVVIEIAGTNAGIDHDQLVITRKTSIESVSLSINLRNGFKPAWGDRFEIARFLNQDRCASASTNFSQISGSDLGGGLILLPEYTSSNVVLVVTNMPAARFYVAKYLGGPYLGGPSRHRIRFHGSSPTNYVLQGSTTLTNWIDLFSNNEPIDLIDYVNQRGDNPSYRFYRVRWGE